MKKYLFGVFALALAIAFSAFTAPKAKVSSQTQYWYEVVSGVTVDVDPVFTGTKAQVLDQQDCNDLGSPICLVESTTYSQLPTTGIAHTNATYFSNQLDINKIKERP